jgi:ketosteroid isomerase-like protein
MRRALVFLVLGFLAGIAIGYFARGATRAFLKKNAHPADMAAIEKLHREDIEATYKQDPRDLTELWSDDAINLGFATPAMGLKAIQDAYAKFKLQYPEFKVLKYAPEIKEVEIADGWAIEVGDFAGTYQMSANGKPVSVQGEGMRLLKRQSDGSWKFALVGMK